MHIIAWLEAHWDELLEVAAALYVLVTLVVSLTPSTEDDAWLRKAAERIALLRPSNAPGRTRLTLPGMQPKRREAINGPVLDEGGTDA